MSRDTPQLCPSSIVCTSTPLPTSNKDWLTLFPLFPPKLHHSAVQRHHYTVHYTVTLLLHFSVSLFFISLSLSLLLFFVYLFLHISGTPVLQFSGSLEFWSYRELFNLYFFTFSTFINGLVVVSLFTPFISIPRIPGTLCFKDPCFTVSNT